MSEKNYRFVSDAHSTDPTQWADFELVAETLRSTIELYRTTSSADSTDDVAVSVQVARYEKVETSSPSACKRTAPMMFKGGMQDLRMEGYQIRWSLKQPSDWKAVAKSMLKDRPTPTIAKKPKRRRPAAPSSDRQGTPASARLEHRLHMTRPSKASHTRTVDADLSVEQTSCNSV